MMRSLQLADLRFFRTLFVALFLFPVSAMLLIAQSDQETQEADAPLLHPKIERLFAPDGGSLIGSSTDRPASVGATDELWDDRFGSAMASSGLDDEGVTMVSDGRNIYVGGAFTEVGGQKADNIAVWNGQRWLYVGNGPGPLQGTNGIVTDMVFYNGILYVAGEFTVAGSDQVNNLAWYQPTSRSWVSLNGGVSSSGGGAFVSDLEVDTSTGLLYVGGRFDRTGRGDAENFAVIDTESKRFLPNPSGPNGVVNAIEVGPDGIYVGGDFSEADGIALRNVGRYDGEGNWNDLLVGVNGPVNAIAAMGRVVFVGGEFTEAGRSDSATEVRNIARWGVDSTSWSILSTVTWLTAQDPQPIGLNGVDGVVRTLMVDGLDLYVGGTFRRAGPGDFTINEISVQYIARWHEFQGESIFHLIRWNGLGRGMDGFVNKIIEHDGSLYAAGSFTTAGGSPAQGIARWDGQQWFNIGTAGTGTFISTMTVRDSTVWVGGEFNRPGSGRTVTLGSLDGTIWRLASGEVNGSIFTVAADGDFIYVGGRFSTAGFQNARNVARYDVTSGRWSALGEKEGPLASSGNGYVSSISFDNGAVILGGKFDKAGGETAQNIVRWNSGDDTWVPLGSGINGRVFSTEVHDGNLYAFGRFLGAGDVLTARNAARFDGTSWHELGAGTDQVIWTSARFYNELYVGGDFDSAGGFAANQLARWNLDGGEWSDIGGIRRDFLPGVNAIATNGRTLYVGGSFDTIAGIEARNVARFDGADWSPLGSGVDNFIYEMAASEGKLFVAGAFTSAGSKPSIYFGIYYDPLLGVDDATTTSILDLSVAPNPATSRGTVAFSTTRNQSVALRIYDPLGRVITTIFEREVPAGDHRIITEAFDHLPSGHYRLVLTTEQENSSIGVTIER